MATQNPSIKPAAQASAAAAAYALPAQIEIFRAGTHTDDAGNAHNFSEADVAGMAAGYNPALRQAPLTIGHPADNLPAYGWVSALKLNAAGRLAMDATQVAPQFAEMVQAGRFKKRSASFYPPKHPNNPTPTSWYLRHVAFLGAQPPAVSGLADFAAGSDAGCVNFSSGAEPAALAQASGSASPPPSLSQTTPEQLTQEQLMDIDLKKQLEAAQAKQAETDAALAAAKAEADAGKAQLAQFAEKARADKTAGFVSFAEGVPAQVLLPKDRPMVVAALEALDAAKPVSFAEGGATKTVSPAEWFKTFVTTRAPVVSFGEHAPAGGGAAATGSAAGKSEAEIDAAAKAHMRANPAVNYMDALSAVTFTA
jgi:hypothetical protein